MKLSGVLMVLAFVVLVILKSQPTWLFGSRQPAIHIRQPTPAEQLEQMKARQLRPLSRPAGAT